MADKTQCNYCHSRNEYGSSRTYNLITIYRGSLSMKQNYHNDFLNTLVYFIIINPLRFNGDSQAPFHRIIPDNDSITPDSSASLGLLQQLERRQYSSMFDFFKYNLIKCRITYYQMFRHFYLKLDRGSNYIFDYTPSLMIEILFSRRKIVIKMEMQ